MRWHLWVTIFVITITVFLCSTHLLENSRYLASSNNLLQQWANSLPEPPNDKFETLKWRIKLKAQAYNQFIEREHLVDGMLVNFSNGKVTDHCDSLLFSSLRFVALRKLGFDFAADQAWNALVHSSSQGKWIRHPRCKTLATSKDMILGLISALSMHPPGYEKVLTDLLSEIERNNGYFSHGPIYLSYLTPTIAYQLARVAEKAGILSRDLPAIIRSGFSTSELTYYFIDGGFKSHLISLSTWLTLEHGPPSSLSSYSMNPPISSQLTDWNTYQLTSLNDGLFNRFLRLKSAGALNKASRYKLMLSLANMKKQFPDNRLPMNCDRKADYLWQRNIEESFEFSEECDKSFNGTDFLWMAALLTDEPKSRMSASQPSH